MFTLLVQSQLQDDWTQIHVEGSRRKDIANVLAAALCRYDFEVMVLVDGEGVPLEEYEWEGEEG